MWMICTLKNIWQYLETFLSVSVLGKGRSTTGIQWKGPAMAGMHKTALPCACNEGFPNSSCHTLNWTDLYFEKVTQTLRGQRSKTDYGTLRRLPAYYRTRGNGKGKTSNIIKYLRHFLKVLIC